MDKKKIAQLIENFAPLNLAEEWDCSGWVVNVLNNSQVQKIMICLTVTDDVIKQAKEQNCDMIISHHPLFFVPFNYKNIDIYCAHTNLDRTQGGTTDKLIEILKLPNGKSVGSFLRLVDFECNLEEITDRLCQISNNVRIVNNKNVSKLKKIAFCAGSGSEFIDEAVAFGADALVTGDIKFHTAVESHIVLFDIGHFESEVHVLKVFAELLANKADIVVANEQSPFQSKILTKKFH